MNYREYSFLNYYHDDNDKYHNENGPAITWKDGSTFYYKHGKCHRLDGPAVIYITRQEIHWYYEGKEIICSSLEEFQRKIKLLAFI